MVEKSCLECGVIFNGHFNSKYCSKKCKKLGRQQANKRYHTKLRLRHEAKIDDEVLASGEDGEEWKEMKGYEGLYYISNKGRVRSRVRRGGGGLMKLSTNKQTGYRTVNVCKNQKHKNFTIHRLLAIHFIPNPEDLPLVDHIDRDRTNNDLSNLRWCSHKTNSINNVKHIQRIKEGRDENGGAYCKYCEIFIANDILCHYRRKKHIRNFILY